MEAGIVWPVAYAIQGSLFKKQSTGHSLVDQWLGLSLLLLGPWFNLWSGN